MKKNTGFIEILLVLSENKTTKKRKVLILSNFTVEECFEFLKMERKWVSLDHSSRRLPPAPGPPPCPVKANLPGRGSPLSLADA